MFGALAIDVNNCVNTCCVEGSVVWSSGIGSDSGVDTLWVMVGELGAEAKGLLVDGLLYPPIVCCV